MFWGLGRKPVGHVRLRHHLAIMRYLLPFVRKSQLGMLAYVSDPTFFPIESLTSQILFLC